MSFSLFAAALLLAGSCVAWAALPLGSYVASLPATAFAALPALIMAARIPKRLREDVRHYLWPTVTFAVLLTLLAAGMWVLQGMGARL